MKHDYELFQSNSLEHLVDSHAHRFVPRDLFNDPVWIVVQNNNMAHWLKLKLAEKNSILANARFLFPDQAVREILGWIPLVSQHLDSSKLLFIDDLKVIIFKILEDVLGEPGHSFPKLARYINSQPGTRQKETHTIRDTRLFDLSDTLAGMFYHYAMNCRSMIESWEGSRCITSENHPRHEDELWQSRLWRILFVNHTDYTHIARLAAIGETASRINPPPVKRLFLFGSAFLTESTFAIIKTISRFVPVRHFSLVPADIYARGEAPRNELLQKWDNLTRGFYRYAASSPIHIIDDFVEIDSHSRLDCLKEHLTKNEPASITPAPNDNSLEFHGVSGKWREIEVLRDLILKELENDTSLKLTDICVLAPDIGNYASFIDAIFNQDAENERLPYNIVDLGWSAESDFIRAVQALFALTNSRFDRETIIRLFSSPCFMQKHSLHEGHVDFLKDFITRTNIHWGIDAAYKKGRGLGESAESTWEFAFRGAIMGTVTDTEEVDPTGTGNSGTIPFPFGGKSDTARLGSIIDILRCLFNDILPVENAKMELAEWVYWIEAFIDAYLEPRPDEPQDNIDRARIKGSIKNILTICEDLGNFENFEDKTFSFSVFTRLFEQFAGKQSGGRGKYLTNGLTFSSLKPLRAIPFKIIILIGMNEGSFPAAERDLSFDLKSLVQTNFDLSRYATDSFGMLETVLSAGKKLVIVYRSIDDQNGAALQPSSCVNELIDFTAVMTGEQRESLILEHPMFAYSSFYFRPESPLRSYSRTALAEAKTFHAQRLPETSIKEYELPEESIDIPDSIAVRRTFRFCRNPLEAHFKTVHGMYLADDEFDASDIHENLTPGWMSKHALHQAALFGERGLAEPEEFIPAEIERANRQGSFTLSRAASLLLDDYTSALIHVRRELESLVPPNAELLTIAASNRQGTSPRTNFIAELVFDTGTGGSIRLYGELLPMFQLDNNTLVSAGCIEAASPSNRHVVSHWISLLCAAAAGMAKTGIIYLFSLKGGYSEYRINMSQVHPAGPRGILQALVNAYVHNLFEPGLLYADILPSSLTKTQYAVLDDPEKTIDEKAVLLHSLYVRALETTYGYNEAAYCSYHRLFGKDPLSAFCNKAVIGLVTDFWMPLFAGRVKR